MAFWKRTGAIVGGILTTSPAWPYLKKPLEWGEHAEFVYHRMHDIKGLGPMLDAILNPPPWLPLILLPFGLILLWLALRKENWPFVRGRVPLYEAATRAYEAAEKASVLHLTTSPTASPESNLTHFKTLFMVDDETELFGIKPPSTISRPIPKSDFHHLHPADGAVSEIHHLFPNDGGAAYVDVTVRRKDLRRVIAGYIAEARQPKWS